MHDAFEMMKCRAGSNWSSLTPMTNVASGSCGRRRDHDSRRARFEVLGRLLALGVLAGRFDHDIDAELAARAAPSPRGSASIWMRRLTDDHRVGLDVHLLGIAPVDRVPSEEPGERLGSA